MTEQFYAVLTTEGMIEVLDCVANNRSFEPAKMAVGDSNGNYYEPEKTQTALKNQKYEGNIFAQGKKPPKGNASGYLYFCFQIPPSEGDYTIREVGLFSSEGKLWAVAKYPETFKTKADSSSNKTLNIEIQIELSDMIINTIIIDDSGNLVTRQVLEEYQLLEEKGKAGGYAPLDDEAKVPLEHLPSTFAPFCFNSGAVDENGNAALLQLSTVTETVPSETEEEEPATVEKKIITLKSPAAYTDGSGKTVTIQKDLTLDVTDFVPGTYSLRVADRNGELIFFSVGGGKVYRQKNSPKDPNLYDLWQDLSVAPHLVYCLEEYGASLEDDPGLAWQITNEVEAGVYTIPAAPAKGGETSETAQSGGGGKLMTNPYNIQNIIGNEIGDPVPTFSNKLDDGWIWLEGAEVSKIAYGKLYEIYGDDYGTPIDPENFVLPDCREKTPWSSPDGSFGYLEPTLPNITGTLNARGLFDSGILAKSGVFEQSYYSNNLSQVAGAKNNTQGFSFNAHNSNPIYQDGATVRPPSIKCRVKTRYR